jgi:hypothetical protein
MIHTPLPCKIRHRYTLDAPYKYRGVQVHHCTPLPVSGTRHMRMEGGNTDTFLPARRATCIHNQGGREAGGTKTLYTPCSVPSRKGHTGDIRRVIRSAGSCDKITRCWYDTVHRVADSYQPRTAFIDRRCEREGGGIYGYLRLRASPSFARAICSRALAVRVCAVYTGACTAHRPCRVHLRLMVLPPYIR